MTPVAPMEAVLAEKLPQGEVWQDVLACLFNSEVRSDWEYSIAAHAAPRFFITSQSLSERGLRSRSAARPASAPR